MNATSLTRHLLLKDMRHQQAWLALLWVFALVLPLAARLVNGNSDGFMVLAEAGLFLLVFLVLGRLIRLDAPGREFNFLATRPVPWGVLLVEKALFIGLFLLIPVWIVKMGSVYMLGIPVSPTDATLVLVENTIHVAVLLAGVGLFALFFRSLWVVSLLVFGTVFLVAICGVYFMAYSAGGGPGHGQMDMSLGSSKLLVFYIGIIATAGVVAILRYRLKSVLKPVGILAVGLALSVLLCRYWSCDLSRFFQNHPRNTGELASPLRDHITFALKDIKGGGNNFSGGTGNGIRYTTVTHEVSIEGVEPPYFATLVDYHAVATLKSGRTISAAFDPVMSNAGRSEALQGAVVRQKVAGFASTLVYPGWNPSALEIFNYLPDQYQNEDLTGATIKGELTLEIHQIVIVKTMPFKTGEVVDLPRRRYLLQEVAFDPDAVHLKLVINSVPSVLRGDDTPADAWRSLAWLVFNRSKREKLQSGGGHGTGTNELLYDVGTSDERLRLDTADDRKREAEPLPADWADNAEISFFSIEPCGRITFPYEVKNVDLQH
jgi:hypothetical protein